MRAELNLMIAHMALNQTKNNKYMKPKLAILAALAFAAIGTTTAVAGRDWNYFRSKPATPTAEKPTSLDCCGMAQMPSACHTNKGKASADSMSCHSGNHESHAGADQSAIQHKSCCK
jgi:hypothetical protein